MGFKPSEKVLAALRGVYNLPFNLDDPVYAIFFHFALILILKEILSNSCPLDRSASGAQIMLLSTSHMCGVKLLRRQCPYK